MHTKFKTLGEGLKDPIRRPRILRLVRKMADLRLQAVAKMQERKLMSNLIAEAHCFQITNRVEAILARIAIQDGHAELLTPFERWYAEESTHADDLQSLETAFKYTDRDVSHLMNQAAQRGN